MSFLKRASTGLFSLLLVSGLLIGGHWIAGGGKRRVSQTPVSTVRSIDSVRSAFAFAPTMPDCKMPESPPASGPVRAVRIMEPEAIRPVKDDSSTLSPTALFQSVIHAVPGRDGAVESHPFRVADASESSVSSAPQPLPLPIRNQAIPLQPEGPELPPIGEPPISAPVSQRAAAQRRQLIERSLPNSSAEEREIWHDALKDFAPKDVREALRMREIMGRMPSSLFDSHNPPPPRDGHNPPSLLDHNPASQPVWTPSPSPIPSQPLRSDSPAPLSAPISIGEPDASRTIAASLAAINQAQQILLNNIANSNTDGYKRVAIAFEGISTLSSSRPGNIGAGVRLAEPMADLSQGKTRHTGRPLDLAIEGEGFFQLEDLQHQQTFYTRCGRFAVNSAGELVWHAGQRDLRLEPVVQVAPRASEIEIDAEGTIKAHGNPSGKAGEHLRIQIVQLPTGADLVPTGENLFVLRGERRHSMLSASDPSTGRLRQGCLEMSNVDVDQELHELEALRHHAQALERAAETLSFGVREPVPPSDPSTIPSHIAGSHADERR